MKYPHLLILAGLVIASVVSAQVPAGRRWTNAGIYPGGNRYQVIERCKKLNIVPQDIADEIMRGKILAILAEPPPDDAWTQTLVGKKLGLQPSNISYWFRKLEITLPPSKRDKKAEILAAIASIGPQWSYSSVGRHLGVSNNQARDDCMKFGLTPPSPILASEIIPAKLKELEGQFWTYTSLGVACGFHKATITAYCKKHGITPPKRSAQNRARET